MIKIDAMKGRLQTLKILVWRTRFFALYQDFDDRRIYLKWVRSGMPIPPPEAVKHRTVKEYAGLFGSRVFIETGTFRGMMVNAMKDLVDEIYSIETSPAFYQQAKRVFSGEKHITILQGDSGEMIGHLLSEINRPCLFWLDAHYSGGITARGDLETPIQRELYHIFKDSIRHDHVILIDDARSFCGKGDYPSIQTLKDSAMEAGLHSFEVKDDIIRICRID